MADATSRPDGRALDRLRECRLLPAFLSEPLGSALIEMGRTKVLCTALVEPGVPPFVPPDDSGWLTAEYAMLPGAGDRRKSRSRDGRSREIGRLVGRALRTAVDLRELGPRTVFLDCDVLQAHGGTRTASVTAAWVALALACRRLEAEGRVRGTALVEQVAAVSVGLVGGAPALDLDRDEDRAADTDMNVVMNAKGRFIEIQGTAERRDFGQEDLEKMLSLARKGIRELLDLQNRALEDLT